MKRTALFAVLALNQVKPIAVRISEYGFQSAPALPLWLSVEFNSPIKQRLVSAVNVVREKDYARPYAYATVQLFQPIACQSAHGSKQNKLRFSFTASHGHPAKLRPILTVKDDFKSKLVSVEFKGAILIGDENRHTPQTRDHLRSPLPCSLTPSLERVVVCAARHSCPVRYPVHVRVQLPFRCRVHVS